MTLKRAVVAVILTQMLAMAAFGQTSEYSRGSGGDIDLITKNAQPFSGSLAIRSTRSGASGMGFGAALGGTLVKDRVWFFATADRSESLFGSRPTFQMTDAKMSANLSNRQSLAASFSSPIPSSFLSLHYTGIVSNNMFVTGSFSGLRRTSPGN